MRARRRHRPDRRGAVVLSPEPRTFHGERPQPADLRFCRRSGGPHPGAVAGRAAGEGGAGPDPGRLTTMNAPDKMKRTGGGLDLERIRADFPILKLKVNGKPLVF